MNCSSSSTKVCKWVCPCTYNNFSCVRLSSTYIYSHACSYIHALTWLLTWGGVSQLSTDHSSIRCTPIVITYSAPQRVATNFYSTLSEWWSSNQPYSTQTAHYKTYICFQHSLLNGCQVLIYYALTCTGYTSILMVSTATCYSRMWTR